MSRFAHPMDSLFELYQRSIQILDERVQEFYTEFKAYLKCHQGCSSCCENVHFKIRYIEALNLLKGYAQLPIQIQQTIQHNLKNPENTHCPLLIDGSCSVYAYRPALCRAYGIIIQSGDQIATCPLNFTDLLPDTPLKKLDLQPFYQVLDELSNELWTLQNSVPNPSENPPPYQSIREFLSAANRSN